MSPVPPVSRAPKSGAWNAGLPALRGVFLAAAHRLPESGRPGVFGRRSANGTSAGVSRAERITRRHRRSWSGCMRPSPGGTAEFPVLARGRIFSRWRRPSLKPLCSRAVRSRAWNTGRGGGRRSRAGLSATLEERRGRHGPARVRPSRWAGHGPAGRAVVRAVPRDLPGAAFTQTKPCRPSTACEPPIRREPAPAGRLL